MVNQGNGMRILTSPLPKRFMLVVDSIYLLAFVVDGRSGVDGTEVETLASDRLGAVGVCCCCCCCGCCERGRVKSNLMESATNQSNAIQSNPIQCRQTQTDLARRDQTDRQTDKT